LCADEFIDFVLGLDEVELLESRHHVAVFFLDLAHGASDDVVDFVDKSGLLFLDLLFTGFVVEVGLFPYLDLVVLCEYLFFEIL
jgi:hypothetical protein